jgi:hypothetical protein
MKKFIEDKIKTESADTLRLLNEKAMVAQKRTSQSKALVYLLPEQPTMVYKGPFAWPAKCAMIAQTLFRFELFENVWKNGCAVSGPIELIRFSNDHVFFRMPHVSRNYFAKPLNERLVGTPQTILGEEKARTVVTKESQGLMEFSTYLKQPVAFQHEQVLIDALYHFIQRRICDPIVGDAALRNVLVCLDGDEHYAVGIDWEENRTGGDEQRAAEKAKGIFGLLCGGKLWGKDVVRVLESVLNRNRESILSVLEYDVGARWAEVEQLIEKHAMAGLVSLSNMKTNYNTVLEVLKSGVRKRKHDQGDEDNGVDNNEITTTTTTTKSNKTN